MVVDRALDAESWTRRRAALLCAETGQRGAMESLAQYLRRLYKWQGSTQRVQEVLAGQRGHQPGWRLLPRSGRSSLHVQGVPLHNRI